MRLVIELKVNVGKRRKCAQVGIFLKDSIHEFQKRENVTDKMLKNIQRRNREIRNREF